MFKCRKSVFECGFLNIKKNIKVKFFWKVSENIYNLVKMLCQRIYLILLLSCGYFSKKITTFAAITRNIEQENGECYKFLDFFICIFSSESFGCNISFYWLCCTFFLDTFFYIFILRFGTFQWLFISSKRKHWKYIDFSL